MFISDLIIINKVSRHRNFQTKFTINNFLITMRQYFFLLVANSDGQFTWINEKKLFQFERYHFLHNVLCTALRNRFHFVDSIVHFIRFNWCTFSCCNRLFFACSWAEMDYFSLIQLNVFKIISILWHGCASESMISPFVHEVSQT